MGVRRSPEQLGYYSHPSRRLSGGVRFKDSNLSPEDYELADYLFKTTPSIVMSAREFHHITEEFDNNLTTEEKQSPYVGGDVGNYHYSAINRGHSDYKFYDRKSIDGLYDPYAETEELLL